jgi:HD superfamily phosphodiesterase
VVRLAAVLHDIGRPHEDRTGGRVCHVRPARDRRGRSLSGTA